MLTILYNIVVKPIKIYSKTRAFNNDLLTPIAAYLKLNQQGAFFLESVEKGHAVGQFSMIGIDPLFQVKGYATYMTTSDIDNQTMIDGNPLTNLSKLYKSIQHQQDGDTPVKIGFFGYFSWEIIQAIEDVTLNQSDASIFDFQIPQILIVFDHAQQMLYITETAFTPITSERRINEVYQDVRTPITDSHYTQVSKPKAINWDNIESNWTKEGYEAAVLKVKDHIKEGDIFQAVISQRFSVPREKDSLSVYRTLRHINPSPYMFYFNYGDTKLIGSSPEILVKSTDGVATLRPIAGTRKRTYENEEALVADLKADQKEVAEHIMLVDLGRNDLGRACDFNSIKINDLMTIERYSHVLHMVTNIEGKLKPMVSPIDLFKATFPAGTVSGAPKIRAIEIINELEPDARQIYSGSVGYFNFDGDCDFCIAIRTIIADDNGYNVQAGAGIVNDSVPENEFQETKSKAEGVLMACFKGEAQ